MSTTVPAPAPEGRRPLTAAEFNARYPVGTPVVAYPGARPEDFPDDPRIVTRTRSKATVLGGHTDVVWVDGHSACIALTHVDVDESRLAGLLLEQDHQYRDLDADSACCLPGLSCPACPPAGEVSRG